MPWRFKHGSRGSELYKITYIFVFKAPSLTHMRFRISHISHVNQTVKLFFKSPGPAEAGPAARRRATALRRTSVSGPASLFVSGGIP